jgi:hypothetical protein
MKEYRSQMSVQKLLRLIENCPKNGPKGPKRAYRGRYTLATNKKLIELVRRCPCRNIDETNVRTNRVTAPHHQAVSSRGHTVENEFIKTAKKRIQSNVWFKMGASPGRIGRRYSLQVDRQAGLDGRVAERADFLDPSRTHSADLVTCVVVHL